MALLKYLKPAGKKELVSVGMAYTSHIAMFPVSVWQGRVSPKNEFHASLKCGDPVQQMQMKTY